MEVEAAARVLDQLGGATGGTQIQVGGPLSKLRESVAIEDDLMRPRRNRPQITERPGAHLEADIEALGAPPSANAFRLVGDIAGSAFETGRNLLLQHFASRRFGLLARLFRGVEERFPVLLDRSRPQAPARAREQEAGALDVPRGETGGGRNLLGVAGAGEAGFDHAHRQRSELDRLAAGGKRLLPLVGARAGEG